MFRHPKCGGQHSTAAEARQCEAAQGSTIVAQRPAQPPATPKGASLGRPLAPLPNVPAGHYAIDSATGNNDLDFFRVDRPTKGKWAGYTFVKRVIGGQADSPVSRNAVPLILKRIVEAGVDEARKRYGQQIGRCALCNRHLTDELSRTYGIGPECRKKMS